HHAQELNEGPLVTIMPMIYSHDQAKMGQLDAILMLKMIRNFIKLSQNYLAEQTIAQGFIIFFNNSEWMTLNFFTNASLKRTQCSAYDPNPSFRLGGVIIFKSFAQLIERMIKDKLFLQKCIRNILSVTYKELKFLQAPPK